MRTEELLKQSQSLQRKCKVSKTNSGKQTEQAQSLRASEELLKNQQEELQQTNEELEERQSC